MGKILKKFFDSIDKKSFISYLIIGGSTAVLYFGSFVIFYRFMHMYYVLALSLSYFLALAVNFVANRAITFSVSGKGWHTQFIKYACVAGFNYLVSVIAARFVVEILHLSPYIGTVAAIGSTVVTGYWLSRHWVYRGVGSMADNAEAEVVR